MAYHSLNPHCLSYSQLLQQQTIFICPHVLCISHCFCLDLSNGQLLSSLISQLDTPPLSSLPYFLLCTVCLTGVLHSPAPPTMVFITLDFNSPQMSPPLCSELSKGMTVTSSHPKYHSVQQSAWNKSVNICCTND